MWAARDLRKTAACAAEHTVRAQSPAFERGATMGGVKLGPAGSQVVMARMLQDALCKRRLSKFGRTHHAFQGAVIGGTGAPVIVSSHNAN